MKSRIALRGYLGFALFSFFLLLTFSTTAIKAATRELFNPNWSIVINDHGYSDIAFDQRPGFEGREYLSGEWAAAVSYAWEGSQFGPYWLTPEFLFPDWDALSGFGVESPVVQLAGTNAYGFRVTRAVVGNGWLRIVVTSEMVDTTNGIPQGISPQSSPLGSNLISDRYVFRQTFSVTNISGATLTNIQFFQFLHSFQATRGVYDDRLYGPTFNGHRFTISQQSPDVDPESGYLIHHDTVSLHANRPPSGWEVGRYGVDPFDDHVIGKPSEGVHLSVEANALSGQDLIAATNLWVSGALRFDLGSLAYESSTNIEFLMSLQTRTVAAPPFRVAAKAGIMAWGDNSVGQTNAPPGPLDVTLLAAGGGHSLAVVSNKAIAWGNNSHGQTNVPASATNIMAIAAGENHSVALQARSFADNLVMAWGNNDFGQTNVPPLPDDVFDVAAGSNHCLALLYDSTVVGWGDNSAGQTSVPFDMDGVWSIAAGGNHSLALLYDGTLVAWGDSSHGLTNVPSTNDFWKIAAGANHNLALDYYGRVFAWGDNSHGQTDVPLAATNITEIAAGRNHSVALRDDGRVFVWGDGALGQTNGGDNIVMTAIAAGGNHTVARRLLPAEVFLSISRSGTNVQLTWPAEVGDMETMGVVLESASGTNPTNWTEIATKGDVENARYIVNSPWAATNRLFRLRITE